MNEETTEWFIEACGVTRSFDGRPALQNVSFRLQKGQFLGIFGPNGAGKTTLLRILSTLIRPSRGAILLDGQDISKRSIDARRWIGFVSHQTLLYGDLTAEENLRFTGRMYGLENLEARVPKLLESVGLQTRGHDRVRTFSRGMKQRLAIARALINDPSLLLLDEPDTGLDYAAEEVLSELLASSHELGRTVVMVTHNLRYGFQTSDRFLFLLEGKVAGEIEKGNLTFESFELAYKRHAIGG